MTPSLIKAAQARFRENFSLELATTPRAQRDERWTCTFVGGDQKAAILQFSVELDRGILWKIRRYPDGMQAMFMTGHNELGIVAARSSIDNAMPPGSQRAHIAAEMVVIDQKTGSFTYSGTSPVPDKNWLYQGKCIRA
jgi:hypothetical protein